MLQIAGGILIAFAVIAGLMLAIPAFILLRKFLKTEITNENHDEWLARQAKAQRND